MSDVISNRISVYLGLTSLTDRVKRSHSLSMDQKDVCPDDGVCMCEADAQHIGRAETLESEFTA